jgi:hypothetical protein
MTLSNSIFEQNVGFSGKTPEMICLAAAEFVVLPPYGILQSVNTSYIRQPNFLIILFFIITKLRCFSLN